MTMDHKEIDLKRKEMKVEDDLVISLEPTAERVLVNGVPVRATD